MTTSSGSLHTRVGHSTQKSLATSQGAESHNSFSKKRKKQFGHGRHSSVLQRILEPSKHGWMPFLQNAPKTFSNNFCTRTPNAIFTNCICCHRSHFVFTGKVLSSLPGRKSPWPGAHVWCSCVWTVLQARGFLFGAFFSPLRP